MFISEMVGDQDGITGVQTSSVGDQLAQVVVVGCIEHVFDNNASFRGLFDKDHVGAVLTHGHLGSFVNQIIHPQRCAEEISIFLQATV